MKVKNTDSKPFLGIVFSCCNVYARIYMSKSQTAYEGACPRCCRRLRVPVGKGGTSRRFFRTR